MGNKFFAPYSRIVLAVATSLVLVTCGSSGDGSSTGPGRYDKDVTSHSAVEAEQAAVWLSGELVAPEELYLTISTDLDAIRSGSSIPELEIEFAAPWEFSVNIVHVSDAGKQKLRDGRWPEFAELNERFGLSKMDTTRLERFNSVILTFAGRQHPERIAEPYEALEDVLDAEPNHICCDWSNVYPWRLSEGMSYLWRSAWGDCLAGCMYSRFWYFRVTAAGVEYVGAYEPTTEPVPPWWDEAKTAYEYFRGF